MNFDIRLTHVALNSSNFQQSIDFYTKWCGLEVVEDYSKNQSEGSIWLSSKGAQSPYDFIIVLFDYEAPEKTLDHLGFQVKKKEELLFLYDKATQAGLINDDLQEKPSYLGAWFSIKDPFGNVVEFTCGQLITGLWGSQLESDFFRV